MNRHSAHNKIYGYAGEVLARWYLRLHGVTILEKNYRCAFGEIDIIAMSQGRVLFIEVKRRSSRAYGSPAQAVSGAKSHHIVMCANAYLKGKGWLGKPARFDVVEIDGFKINYIRGAFCADV